MTHAINAKHDALGDRELDAVSGGSIKEIAQRARENLLQSEAQQAYQQVLNGARI